MKRLILPLALVALGGLTWLLLSNDAPVQPKSTAPPTDAPVRPPPLPALGPGVPFPEELGEDEVPTQHMVAITGPLGRDPAFLEGNLKPENGWRPVEGDPYTWTDVNQTRLSFQVANGRVVGAEAVFAPRAMAADLTSLSYVLVGSLSALPMHWEAYTIEDAQKPLAGAFKDIRGNMLYYRGRLRSVGEPPYGPETLEISVTPFAEDLK